MAIKIEGEELKGESYLTIDKSGCWIWENTLPVLDNKDNCYKLPIVKKDEDVGIRDWNAVGREAVKSMLNLEGLDFHFVYKIFNGGLNSECTPRIFKVTLSELTNEE